jgi:hypothetical protein
MKFSVKKNRYVRENFFVQKEVSWMRACERERHAMNLPGAQKHRNASNSAPSAALKRILLCASMRDPRTPRFF